MWSLKGTTFTQDSLTYRLVVEGWDGTIYVRGVAKPRGLVIFPPVHTDGDVAVLYHYITGKKHPMIKGEMSEDYKAFLERQKR